MNGKFPSDKLTAKLDFNMTYQVEDLTFLELC